MLTVAKTKNITWKGTPLKRKDHFYVFTDNPETLETIPDGNEVIWYHKIESEDKKRISYRVLNWHRNRTGVNLKFGLTLQNLGEREIQIKQIKYAESFRGGNYFQSGINIANACLSDSFYIDDEVMVFPPDGEIKIIVNNDFYSGLNSPYFAMYAFELVSEKPLNYVLRVAADEHDIRSRDGDIMEKQPPAHARGTWKYDAIRVVMDEPFCTEDDIQRKLRISEFRQGPNARTTSDDVKLFAVENSDHPEQSNPNKGLYGVDLHIDLSFTNDSSSDIIVPIHIEIPEEHIDNIYAGYCGAYRFNKRTYKIPIIGLRRGEHPVRMKLFDVVVPAKVFTNSPYVKTFVLQHGGTSSLPIDLIIG